MIKLAYGISYDANLIVNQNTDFVLFDVGANNYDWIECYMQSTQAFHGCLVNDGLTDSVTEAYINRFATAFDVLQNLCKQFACIPKYIYGTTDGVIDANKTHRIFLNSRGRSYSDKIVPAGNILKSKMLSDTPFKPKTIRVTDFSIPSESSWYFTDVRQMGDEPPPFANFDIDLQVDFSTIATQEWRKLYAGAGTHEITTVAYWDYIADGYVTPTVAETAENEFALMLSKYLHNRFPNGRTQYNREYGSLQATKSGTTSQRYLQTIRRTDILDGKTTRTFYATTTKKNIMTNQASVIWVEE
jgi:hypothetical protein